MSYHKMIFFKRFRKKVFEMINFRYYFEGLKCIILILILILISQNFMIRGETTLLELWTCHVLLTEVTYMYIERVNRKII